MDLGAFFLILAVLVLVGVFISRPFLVQQAADGSRANANPDKERVRSALMAEHERILNALQELDFDFGLGKIPEEEYPEQRLALLQSGADVLRQLDSLQEQTPSQAAEARIEAAIAARRADAGRTAIQAATLTVEDDELERLIAARRQGRQEKAAGFCPRCGKPVQKSDRFCPKCGAVVEEEKAQHREY